MRPELLDLQQLARHAQPVRGRVHLLLRQIQLAGADILIRVELDLLEAHHLRGYVDLAVVAPRAGQQLLHGRGELLGVRTAHAPAERPVVGPLDHRLHQRPKRQRIGNRHEVDGPAHERQPHHLPLLQQAPELVRIEAFDARPEPVVRRHHFLRLEPDEPAALLQLGQRGGADEVRVGSRHTLRESTGCGTASSPPWPPRHRPSRAGIVGWS